jgi:CHAT domain-containing protein
MLGHIPFEVLLIEEGSAKTPYAQLSYLLTQYELSYNYSLSLWREQLSIQKKVNNGKMLALAATYSSKQDSSNQSVNRSDYLRSLRDVLTPLPKAEEEVKNLEASYEGKFWFGKDANENQFKEQAQDFSIIHLAMHGLLNKRSPILSALAFTENLDSLNDNFLEAWEIAHLKLKADLVVLSACETGYGKFEQGEGVMSLARSFMFAGVSSMVVSLWQVNDASTSIIMQNFYAQLKSGKTKAAALRDAKLNYIQRADGIAAQPAFWAPFIQLGDSRPIKIRKKSNESWLWWIIGGATLLVVGIGFGISRRKRSEIG